MLIDIWERLQHYNRFKNLLTIINTITMIEVMILKKNS